MRRRRAGEDCFHCDLELCVVLYPDLVSAEGLPLLDIKQLFDVFGMFLVVLIAVELMASIYMYMMDKSVHVEIMLLIAITALARSDSCGARM
ncbi:phosphate-starvation-inducible PsiE family protein [Thiocystis violacea]|uniref:phosphate-starvation-inducible PsiE family protein n=1 Tax=Thiocystis violacea TaxID=13725 RepID=UPI001904CAB4|nr:hypothetical protein [Thiocystis violacea]